MGDLLIRKSAYQDYLGGAITGGVPCITFEYTLDGNVTKKSCNSQDIIMIIDDQNNTLNVYAGNQKFYEYTEGDTYNTVAIADADAMFLTIQSELYV